MPRQGDSASDPAHRKAVLRGAPSARRWWYCGEVAREVPLRNDLLWAMSGVRISVLSPRVRGRARRLLRAQDAASPTSQRRLCRALLARSRRSLAPVTSTTLPPTAAESAASQPAITMSGKGGASLRHKRTWKRREKAPNGLRPQTMAMRHAGLVIRNLIGGLCLQPVGGIPDPQPRCTRVKACTPAPTCLRMAGRAIVTVFVTFVSRESLAQQVHSGAEKPSGQVPLYLSL